MDPYVDHMRSMTISPKHNADENETANTAGRQPQGSRTRVSRSKFAIACWLTVSSIIQKVRQIQRRESNADLGRGEKPDPSRDTKTLELVRTTRRQTYHTWVGIVPDKHQVNTRPPSAVC